VAAEERAELQKAEIGIIGGSGLYAMPGLTGVREHRVERLRRAVGCVVLGELEGRKWRSWHGMGGTPLAAERAELPGEHLCDEAAGSGANSVGVAWGR